VVIKSIPTEKYIKLTYENLISEANAMYICRKSPHIISLVDSFQTKGETFIVSKFAPEGNLLNYLTNQTSNLNEERAQHIIHQLAKGIRDIHHQGLIHRDLKFLNIFVQDDSNYPKVKIGDFGLACKLTGTEC
jgi:serine/threonine protein kinase